MPQAEPSLQRRQRLRFLFDIELGRIPRMVTSPQENLRGVVDGVYRAESRRVFATLVRLLRDFDLAEEALHEAFTAAVERWEREGVPANPRAWLISTGRFKAIDALRRRGRFDKLKLEVAQRWEEVAEANAARADEAVEDDRLRLIFTCCHPAIAPNVQVPLTLREVCGLTTEEIASAFSPRRRRSRSGSCAARPRFVTPAFIPCCRRRLICPSGSNRCWR